MKSFLLLMALSAHTCLAGVNLFDLGTLPPDLTPQIWAAEMASRGKPPPDPWRNIAGIDYNVFGPGFRDWYFTKNPRQWEQLGKRPIFPTGWFLFSGKVVEVQPLGIRVVGSNNFFDTAGEPSELFIVNYPRTVAEGDFIDWHLAREDGTYRYTTVAGGARTLHQLDYGQVLPAPPQAAPLTPEQAAAARAASEARRAELRLRALHYDQVYAARGDCYSERRMGERYRDGQDVARDLRRAKGYLTQAADQGDTTARQELADLTAGAAQ